MSDIVKYKVPTLAEIHEDNLEVAYKNEQLNLLLNQPPKKEWIKKHPFIDNHYYLPIDKVEFMLRKIFKMAKIEVLREGTMFNAVYCAVRVHYFHPIQNEWMYYDGVGACQLQTKKGTSASDLVNINNGAVSMALPIAKTLAVKDACDHFGNVFGANLNRKDTVQFTADGELANEKSKQEQEHEELTELYSLKKDSIHDLLFKQDVERVLLNKEHKSYKKIKQKLSEL